MMDIKPFRALLHLGIVCSLVLECSAVSLRGEMIQNLTQAPAVPSVFMQVCQFCFRQCPISCFAGTCGLDYGVGVRRFQATNQCYSCEAPSTPSFQICSPEASGATKTYNKPAANNPALSGPALAGDADATVKTASAQAQFAVQTLQAAALGAEKAAMQAVGAFHGTATAPVASAEPGAALAAAGASDADNEAKLQAAQAHQLATQIRANEALKASQAAHAAWKATVDKYNAQMAVLRREQMLAEEAEENVDQARKVAEAARQQYIAFEAQASAAAKDAIQGGEVIAQKMMAQQKAEETASTARAAQRRLTTAVNEAMTATRMTQSR